MDNTDDLCVLEGGREEGFCRRGITLFQMGQDKETCGEPSIIVLHDGPPRSNARSRKRRLVGNYLMELCSS